MCILLLFEVPPAKLTSATLNKIWCSEHYTDPLKTATMASACVSLSQYSSGDELFSLLMSEFSVTILAGSESRGRTIKL